MLLQQALERLVFYGMSLVEYSQNAIFQTLELQIYVRAYTRRFS